ncbi:hypothetical protein K440DRAFT_625680 [Wilcoxina mikolae CBS 423.85]|nr:hypothetical protein K440DRAFT_625680 [Wilcoxina mikolae CBS 423.85]
MNPRLVIIALVLTGIWIAAGTAVIFSLSHIVVGFSTRMLVGLALRMVIDLGTLAPITGVPGNPLFLVLTGNWIAAGTAVIFSLSHIVVGFSTRMLVGLALRMVIDLGTLAPITGVPGNPLFLVLALRGNTIIKTFIDSIAQRLQVIFRRTRCMDVFYNFLGL